MKELAKSPRLVYIVTSAPTANVLLRGQLRALVLAGFDVAVITSPDLDLDEIANREGVNVFPVRMEREMSPVQDLVALSRLYLVLRKLRPDIVNASTPKAGLLGMMAAAVARVPVRIYLLRGLRLETARGWQRRVLLAAEWIASQLAHDVVCNSVSLHSTYLDLKLAPPSKVTVLGDGSSNGVDTSRFHPCSSPDEESARLRQELAFDAGDLVIGFVGRLTRDKGICDLLEAYDEAAQKLDETRLLLVGDFETGDPLPTDVIERIAGDDRIVVTGFVDDTAPYYRLMDLLVFPSYREGFPNAPLEAAATALPVVGYRATGTVDAVSDGETGILVEIADRKGLADAICTLLDDPVLMEKMAAAARQRAVTLYDSGKVWHDWADFYSERVVERVLALR